MSDARMVVLGRLVVPYGVRGWFKLHAFADDPAAWCALPQWWIAASSDAVNDPSQWRAINLESVREHGKGLVAKLEGIDDRTASEAHQGFYVAVPREVMPVTAEGEFYWDDLIGLAVQNGQGEVLGKIEALIEAAGNDVLVVVEDVAGKRVERLLPFVDAVVKEVNVTAGHVRVEWERDW